MLVPMSCARSSDKQGGDDSLLRCELTTREFVREELVKPQSSGAPMTASQLGTDVSGRLLYEPQLENDPAHGCPLWISHLNPTPSTGTLSHLKPISSDGLQS